MQDIIKCGSYTGNGSSGSGPDINLGFEPQWVMIKRTDSSGSWRIFDVMRGFVVGGTDSILKADATTDEAGNNFKAVRPTSTGFKLESASAGVNGNGGTYIYMAIRRGPLAAPDDATKVFAMSTRGATTPPPAWVSGFPVDFALETLVNNTGGFVTASRLTSGNFLNTSSTGAETDYVHYTFDYNNGWSSMTGTNSNNQSWMWKRAPSFFDVCCYSGTGSNRTVSHNLGVVPEMMWVKARNWAEDWNVYHSALGNEAYLKLNTTNQVVTSTNNRWNSTSPTASVFSLGTTDGVNKNSYNFIAYLFATVAGVSKVGSYTGNGSTQNIDCGFSSGARFVLIKRTDVAEGWKVHDSVRGIVAGDDPFLELNNTNAENSSFDLVDPYSGGFAVNNFVGWNASGGSYIFYAIA
jgi:hypothetical protein